MGTGRIGGWVLGGMAVAAIAVVVTVAVQAGTGEVDPAGAIAGLIGLVVALWCGHLALLALGWQDTDTIGLADRLAIEVRTREEQDRKQLLGGSDRTINTRFTFVPAPAHNATGAARHGTVENVAGYYSALRPGRLVITGAPGAGKTVLALHLLLLLLADRAPGDPVPVRLSLSSFDPYHNTLQGWIADHLTRAYRLRPRAAAALVAARLVLPVLDGLDEMEADTHPRHAAHAKAALEAMNDYLHGTAKGQLVVTCRSAPYDALEGMAAWAQDAARIEIAPVSATAARAFVISRTPEPTRWEQVLDALRADPMSVLARGLSTPWRLTMAVSVYDQRTPDGTWVRDPRELLNLALQTPEEIRDHMMGLLIPAATSQSHPPVAAHVSAARYTPQQVQAWLTVLACYLHTNITTARVIGGRQLPGTDMVLHELWPLASARRPRVVHTLLPPALLVVTGWPALLLGGWRPLVRC